jgi:hypothetical protein
MLIVITRNAAGRAILGASSYRDSPAAVRLR